MSKVFLSCFITSICLVVALGIGSILWVFVEVFIEGWKEGGWFGKSIVLGLSSIAIFGVLFVITWGLGQ